MLERRLEKSASRPEVTPDDLCTVSQGEFFMVQDVYSKADVLNTTGSYGAPNFRQVKGSYPLYGMGQPSLNGFKQVLQWLQAQGHEVSLHIIAHEIVDPNISSCCAEPTVAMPFTFCCQ